MGVILFISIPECLHTLRRLYSQQSKAILYRKPSTDDKSQFGQLFIFAVDQDLLVMIELVEGLSNADYMARYYRWLVLFAGLDDDLLESVYQL